MLFRLGRRHPPRSETAPADGGGEEKKRSARSRTAAASPNTSGREAGGARLALGVAHEVVDAQRGDGEAEVRGGRVLEQVRLVEDEGVVGRDDLPVCSSFTARSAQRR